MAKTYRTAKGTELPLLDLRGRDYLEVKYRLVWFREEHSDWAIETELVSVSDKAVTARAVIRDGSGRLIATSHKFENQQGFPDFLEKAETGAIGRALALIGYGTQFCADELDEGERIVDSPVAPGLRRGDSLESQIPDPGEFQVPFGKKYRGKKINEIPRSEIEAYLAWLEADAEKKRTPLSFEVRLLKKAVEMYYSEEPTGLEAGEAG
jgi:hypothetical protein